MTSLSSVDPKLERSTSKFFRLITEKFFKDPTITKLYHPKFKGENFFWDIRDQLMARNKAKQIRRKHQGKFSTMDILNENKLRLLCLNMGEMIALKNTDIFKQLKTASTNLTRGFLQGYTINLALCLGIHGASSNSLKESRFPLLRYFANFVGLSVLAYPLQYWAYQQFHFQDRARPLYPKVVETFEISVFGEKRSFAKSARDINLLKMKRCFLPFMGFSVFYGASVAAFNSSQEYVRYLYYPGILASACSLSAAGYFFRAIQGVGSFKGTVHMPFTAGFKNPVNLGSVMFFVLLNLGFPLVIPQLKSKEEYKNEYFDYLEENSVHLFGQESAFQ